MLENHLKQTFERMDAAISEFSYHVIQERVGIIKSVGDGIAILSGLQNARVNEILLFPGDIRGLAFNLDRDALGCILLGFSKKIHAGDKVRSTGDVLKVPVGKEVIGRVMTPLGDSLDGRGLIPVERYEPIERDAAQIIDRQ